MAKKSPGARSQSTRVCSFIRRKTAAQTPEARRASKGGARASERVNEGANGERARSSLGQLSSGGEDEDDTFLLRAISRVNGEVGVLKFGRGAGRKASLLFTSSPSSVPSVSLAGQRRPSHSRHNISIASSAQPNPAYIWRTTATHLDPPSTAVVVPLRGIPRNWRDRMNHIIHGADEV